MRLRDALGTVLPLVLMAGLAAGTWWLVNIAPVPAGAGGPAAPPDTPDYILRDFALRRYLPSGELQGLIEGRVLRHYPADDRHEVDGLTLRTRDAAGQWIVATALRGEADGQGRWVRLNGQAVVQRDAAAGGTPLRVEGEAFEVRVDEGRIRSDTPVRLVQEGLVVHGAGLDYEEATQRLVLLPPVRAEWRPSRRSR